MYSKVYPIPDSLTFVDDPENGFYLSDKEGNITTFDQNQISIDIGKATELSFKILYIGQAYGENGERNALDRLKKHETLQKISLKGIDPDSKLVLLLLQVTPNNQLITFINPWAAEKDTESKRISNGLDKLFNTSEAEKTTLFEAAFIRYFSPEYNKIFKDSFPSTNMKILSDCYEKDFASISAEINFDQLPFNLCSDTIPVRNSHTAYFDLHAAEDRKVFFNRK